MKTKQTLRMKRDDAVAKAKAFAMANRYDMAEIWMRRAASYMPLSPLQSWAFKKIVGDYKFKELHLQELPIQEDRP